MKSFPPLPAFAIILVGLALGCTPVIRAETSEPTVHASIRPDKKLSKTEMLELARVSFDLAMKKALTAVPGEIIQGELEVEDGNLMYSFEVVTSAKVIKEVEIDAGDGRVLDVGND